MMVELQYVSLINCVNCCPNSNKAIVDSCMLTSSVDFPLLKIPVSKENKCNHTNKMPGGSKQDKCILGKHVPSMSVC